jgi:antitoxin component YwqK of YwqJK toxin-antitoxin module
MATDTLQEQIREFTERGVVILRQTLVDDLPHGPTECFDLAGQLTAELVYQQGLLQGAATYYSLGQAVRTCTYDEGLLHGEVLDYSLSGVLVQRSFYAHGLLHGVSERYWTNGRLMERQTFEQGRASGPPEQFDSEGAPMNDASTGPNASRPGLLQRLFTGEG